MNMEELRGIYVKTYHDDCSCEIFEEDDVEIEIDED